MENFRKEGDTSGENNLKVVVVGSYVSLRVCIYQVISGEIEINVIFQ